MASSAKIAQLSVQLEALLNVDVVSTRPISKSKFVEGLRCPKSLYLLVHHPELAVKTDDPIAAQGITVGLLAQDAFPGGVSAAGTLFDASSSKVVSETKRLMADPNINVIYEAAFEADGVKIRTDILIRDDDGWVLIEVKASNEIKPRYIDDISLQGYIVRRSGVKLSRMVLMHLNKDYVYAGGRQDLGGLFVLVPEGPAWQAQPDSWVKANLNQQFAILGQNEPPAVDCGGQCKKDGLECGFYDHCHESLPQDNVAYTPISSSNKWSKIAKLRAAGVASIQGIDPTTGFTPIEQGRVERAQAAFKADGPIVNDEIAGELAGLRFPLGFLDFESISHAIPQVVGTSPWEVVPMQFSLHWIEEAGAPLQHSEFLAEADGTDPRVPFIEALLTACEPLSKIVVYSPFESVQIKHLAKAFPEYAERLLALVPKLWDLCETVKNCVYHPAFAGSYSIKNVLPALVPGMNYDGLAIANGMDVFPAWEKLRLDRNLTFEERSQIRTDLLVYCCQDTLAMVRVLEVLVGRRGVDR